jgi:hypothetical protein
MASHTVTHDLLIGQSPPITTLLRRSVIRTVATGESQSLIPGARTNWQLQTALLESRGLFL